MPSGTVLLSCAASLGKVSITVGPVYANQQLYGLVARPDAITPEYLAVSLSMRGDRFYRALAGTSTLGFFSKAKALSIRIPVPPIESQQAFTTHIAGLKQLQTSQASAVERAEGAFQSLLAGVFGAGDQQ